MTKPGDSPTKKTLHELAKEFPEKTYKELEKYRNADRQEAEGELSIMKGIETNRVKEAQARSSYLQDELDRVKRENNDLHNKVAALLDAVAPENTSSEMKRLISEVKGLKQQLHTDRIKAQEVQNELDKFKNKTDPAHTIQKARESGL